MRLAEHWSVVLTLDNGLSSPSEIRTAHREASEPGPIVPDAVWLVTNLAYCRRVRQ
jgi:hypothetical protein